MISDTGIDVILLTYSRDAFSYLSVAETQHLMELGPAVAKYLLGIQNK